MVNITQHIDETTGKRILMRNWFLEAIREGRFKPGQSIPTRYELAKTFNCSRATADFTIKTLIDEQILSASRGKGTFVRDTSGTQKTNTIALINGNPLFSWSHEIEMAFIEAIGRKRTINRFTSEDIIQPSEWEKCKSNETVVFVMPHAEHASYLHELRRRKITHLVLYRDPPESSFVNIDQAASARLMVKKLREKGCKKLAWVGITESRYKSPEERYAGYLEGLLLENLPFIQEWSGLSSTNTIESKLHQIFTKENHPDAVVAGQINLGPLIKAIYNAGLTPGKDIIIGSLDEVKDDVYPFPLLSVNSFTEETGRKAAEIILNNIDSAKSNALRCYLNPEIKEVIP
ncbi:MAG: substrate-binding domain-containing protein [Fibrobacteres bacterium]|nr:substrate-binding domain-containing protein [Fibrobacterota bacterium]